MTANVTYIQCALLYTSSNGERRIRVHTMVVPVVSELADLYRWVLATPGGWLGLMAAQQALHNPAQLHHLLHLSRACSAVHACCVLLVVAWCPRLLCAATWKLLPAVLASTPV